MPVGRPLTPPLPPLPRRRSRPESTRPSNPTPPSLGTPPAVPVMTDSRPGSPKPDHDQADHPRHEETGEHTEAETTTTEEPVDASTTHDLNSNAEALAESTAPSAEPTIDELRASLAASQDLVATQTTKLSALVDVETELAALKDQFKFLSAAKEAVERQLQEEIKRREVAEENIEMLRGQVEQARRGVGLLHKQEQERKRMSLLPAAVPDEEEAANKDATSKASKRASFLGRASRRTSGQEGDWQPAAGSQSPASLGAPPRAGLRELRLGSGGLYGANAALASPTTGPLLEEDDESSARPTLARATSSTHSSPRKSQEEALRSELAATKAKLADAEEARDASESCLKALREFMAGSTDGVEPPEDILKGIRLPPLPTDRDPDYLAPEAETGATKKGWAFNIWRQAVSPPGSTIVEPSATPADSVSVAPSTSSPRASPLPFNAELPTEAAVGSLPSASAPLASFVSGWTKSVAPGTPADKPAATRSISSFFSRKKEEPAPTSADQDKDLPAQPADGETTPVASEPVVKEGEEQPAPEEEEDVKGHVLFEEHPSADVSVDETAVTATEEKKDEPTTP